ncbi:hypothetical protein ACSBR2_012591 [Camellia fascicularis]
MGTISTLNPPHHHHLHSTTNPPHHHPRYSATITAATTPPSPPLPLPPSLPPLPSLSNWREIDEINRELPKFKRDISDSGCEKELILPLAPQKIETFKDMEGWVEKNVLMHLKLVEKCWQPQDLLLDSTSEEFFKQVKEVMERAKGIPN